jgi:hypothetical protein
VSACSAAWSRAVSSLPRRAREARADPDPNPRLTTGASRRPSSLRARSLDEAARSGARRAAGHGADVFEALGVVEDELIEEYLDGTSSDPDRAAFEKSFLTSPQRRARLRLAESLRRHASRREGDRTGSTAAKAILLPVAADVAGARRGGSCCRWPGNLWTRFTARKRSERPALQRHPWRCSPTPWLPLWPRRLAPSSDGTIDDADRGGFSARSARKRSKAEARVAALEETLGVSRSSVTFVLAAGALRSAGSASASSYPATRCWSTCAWRVVSANDYPSYRAVLLTTRARSSGRLRSSGRDGVRHSFVLLALTPIVWRAETTRSS